MKVTKKGVFSIKMLTDEQENEKVFIKVLGDQPDGDLVDVPTGSVVDDFKTFPEIEIEFENTQQSDVMQDTNGNIWMEAK